MTARVLFLSHSAQLGGAELCLHDLARHTPGSQVILFSDGPFANLLKSSGTQVEVLQASTWLLDVRRGSRWKALLALPSLLWLAVRLVSWARRFDQVHCNTQKAFIVGAIAGLLARRPVIWYLHDILTHKAFDGWGRRIAILMANWISALVIANSKATAVAFAAVGGRMTKAAVLYNGISPPKPPATQRRRLRLELGVETGTILIGCFSRFSPWKGQHVLVEALEQLGHDSPLLRAIFVGSPLFGEEAYAQRVERLVAQLGLRERIMFLGFRSDIPDLMAACDLIVHTSVEPEPFGRVILEGQAAGKPVIATDAGGAQELIADGRTGLLVPPGDPLALAAAIHMLAVDTSLRQSVAQAGRYQAYAQFSVNRMITGFHRLIASVAQGSRGKTR